MGGGPQGGGALIGDTELLTSHLHLQNTRRINFVVDLYISSILRGLIGLVILSLFFVRSSERAYLWFGLGQMFGCAEDVLEFVHTAYGIIPMTIFDLLDGIGAAGFWIASMLFVANILAPRRGTWFRLSLILAVASPLATPLYWYGWLPVPATAALSSALVVPCLLWPMVVLVRRALDRDPDAILLGGPILLIDSLYLVANAVIDAGELGWMRNLIDLFNLRIPMKPFPISYYSIFNTLYLLALLAFLVRRFTLARTGEEKLQSQIEAASQVQTMLVPTTASSGANFRIESVYLPAEIVGGDFFQHLPDGEGGVVIIVGDVAGKGLPAAMMVSMLVGAFHAEARHTMNPARLLNSLNERMLERSSSGFATCLAAHVSATGHCSIVNAGHLPPYIDGLEVELPACLPLGITDKFSPTVVSLQLEPGQTLTLVSDGVVEAQNKSGELFGFERTAAVSTRAAEDIARAARDFGQEDDITVLKLTFAPVQVMHA